MCNTLFISVPLIVSLALQYVFIGIVRACDKIEQLISRIRRIPIRNISILAVKDWTKV